MDRSAGSPLVGVVTARNCPLCGHQEIGLTTPDGHFYALQPGLSIQILPDQPPASAASPTSPAPQPVRGPTAVSQPQILEPPPVVEKRPWVPEALRGDPILRRKYGVMIGRHLKPDAVTPEIYVAAYLKKLEKLVECLVDIPLPIVLDRHFNAPLLASGDPDEVALALWSEIDEIRVPAEMFCAWLEHPTGENLERLVHPRTVAEVESHAIDDEALEADLNRLGLEEFLALL